MVSGGALSRDVLEKAVGDHAVGLADALVAHGSKINPVPWIEFGVRGGLTRLSNTKVTAAFIRELKLTDDSVNLLLSSWVFPFAKNAYGQMLVAMMPEVPVAASALALCGPNPIRCVATLPEFGDLRAAYRAST